MKTDLATLPPIDPARLHERRERVFLLFAVLFVGSMAMLNIIGITRFVQIGPLSVAVGVLPYPLTFLCSDFICEFYGRRRATQVVWAGLLVNLFVLGTLWLGHVLPPVGAESQPPWQVLPLATSVYLPDGDAVEGRVELYDFIYACTKGAVLASMFAYLAAQFCDVFLFHFWKKITKGRHLWLRNNGSTMVSQFVDSVIVISVTFGAAFFRGETTLHTMLVLLGGSYAFKICAAALDTIPFYVGTFYLSRYLRIDPTREHHPNLEETRLSRGSLHVGRQIPGSAPSPPDQLP